MEKDKGEHKSTQKERFMKVMRQMRQQKGGPKKRKKKKGLGLENKLGGTRNGTETLHCIEKKQEWVVKEVWGKKKEGCMRRRTKPGFRKERAWENVPKRGGKSHKNEKY